MSCFDNIEAFREEHRILKKDTTVGARAMYSDLWNEYINRFGVMTTYYVHGYNVKTQDDFIYGEDPTAPFDDGITVNMMVDYQLDSLMLSKFGIENLSDLTAIVSIKDYQNKFGLNAEPKPGDVLELTEAGWLASEMPIYDDAPEHFNIIGNIAALDISTVDVSVSATSLAPIKDGVTETTLSYMTPMFTTLEAVTGNLYPIENDLLSVTESLSTGYYLRIPNVSETYFVPLYTTVETILTPTTDTLYFDYDIVDLNGADIISGGYFPFEYQDDPLLMPVYTHATSGEPAPVVIKEAEDLDYLDMSTADLLCKYRDPDYVATIKVELSGLYGAKYIRYPQLFEVTEVKYQDFSQPGVNFAQGHYVWVLHAKRFDYSFEPNAPSEGPVEKVYDNSFFGTLSTQGNVPTEEKVYDENVEDAGDEIWDYEEEGTDTGPYGYY